ncbi:hypothetical protein SAMN06269117_1299 [Balnearium lithotrophicum]|uniref:Uncharacterized protein n=1 Tax=Balnearium lithotrophicum TaxID=223788 RepID=A0A521E021_9BACT|nr:hypothetical protein [Balnearium lithotrophicum]SMO77195.1 hypothetical protein SAMN06269117_1299 [Balnearium lithotrophicum]
MYERLFQLGFIKTRLLTNMSLPAFINSFGNFVVKAGIGTALIFLSVSIFL